MQYRSEIDGLRAVAVVPVILFHAGFASFSGGFVGVDVFFVISGYLITTLLIEELQTGRFSIARFYERRARRILPALFFVLACTTAAGWVWMVPSQFQEYSRALLAVVLFVSNIYLWRTEDYFAPVAELNPLLHTWSLAVEEQFYILFPILLLGIWRFGRNPAFWTVVVLTLASLLASEWGWRNKPSPNFFLLPTRAWELGAGAICAFLLRDAPPRPNALLSGLGFGMILVSVFAYDASTPFPSIYALAPVGGTALVILYGRQGTPVARLLSLRLVVGLGLISYSAYLWHQPLFALARIRSLTEPSHGVMLVLALAALVLACLSWRFVEQPFRRRPVPVLPSRNGVFAASAFAAAAFVAVGVYGQVTEGRVQSWMSANPDRAQVYRLYDAALQDEGAYLDDGACQFNSPDLGAKTIERILACREIHGPGTAIFGDSHAIDVYNGLHQLHDSGFLFGMTFPSCWLAGKRTHCDFDGFATLLRDNPGIFDQVIYHQAGYRYFASPDGVTDRDLFQRVPEYAALLPEEFVLIEGAIERGLEYLTQIAEDADLIWLGPRVEPHIGLNFMLNRGCENDFVLREGLSDLFTGLDRRIASMAETEGVAYVSLIDAVGFDMESDFMTCANLYWRDGDHWSAEGARLFIGRLLAELPVLRAGTAM